MSKSLFQPLPIAVIRRLILIAILFILFWNVTYWIGETWNKISGLLWGIITAGIAIFCRYKATRSVKVNNAFVFWMSVPAVLTVVPLVIWIMTVLKKNQSSPWAIIWQMAPLLISLIIPVGLLAIAFKALKHHLPPNDKPSRTPPAT